MKIRFLKNTAVQVIEFKTQEVFDRTYKKWDTIRVASIVNEDGLISDVITEDRDIMVNVPMRSYEIMKQEEKESLAGLLL